MKSPTVQPSQICVDNAIGVSSKRKPRWLVCVCDITLTSHIRLADCQIETSQRGRGKSPSIYKIFQRQKVAVSKKFLSILVLRSAILITRLEVVVSLTQRLPIRLIPEESLVSTVRNDVIDHSGLHIPSLLHALDAQWMRRKVLLPRFLPCAVVSTVIS